MLPKADNSGLLFGGMSRPAVRDSGLKFGIFIRLAAQVSQVLLQGMPMVSGVHVGIIDSQRCEISLRVIISYINQPHEANKSLALIVIIKGEIADKLLQWPFKLMRVSPG